jgi:hypothetical protein
MELMLEGMLGCSVARYVDVITWRRMGIMEMKMMVTGTGTGTGMGTVTTLNLL